MSDTAVSADPDFDEDSEGEDLGLVPIRSEFRPGSSSQAAAGALQLLPFRRARADRLDKVLAGLMPEHSRSRLQGWIEAGKVLVNGGPAKVRQVVGPTTN